MNIGFFADGPWAHQTIKKIVNSTKFKILFIVPRYDTRDPILKNWAKTLKIDFLTIKNVNTLNSIKKLEKYNADLFVSMSFNQIIKKKLINVPPKGFINCHAGALPFYRGRCVLNWVLINGEKKFGVTVHFIDEGIDTGDIISQKIYKIKQNDNYKTLLRRSEKYCANLLVNSIIKISKKKLSTIKQSSINKKGSYFKLRKVGDEVINWNQKNKDIFNFVRALVKPGPVAESYFRELGHLKIERVKLLRKKNSKQLKPGSIIDIKNKKLIVSTLNGSILVEKYYIKTS